MMRKVGLGFVLGLACGAVPALANERIWLDGWEIAVRGEVICTGVMILPEFRRVNCVTPLR